MFYVVASNFNFRLSFCLQFLLLHCIVEKVFKAFGANFLKNKLFCWRNYFVFRIWNSSLESLEAEICSAHIFHSILFGAVAQKVTNNLLN